MRTALITGGSGGIGRACARDLAADHDVAIQYHSNEQSARDVAAEIDSDSTADGSSTVVQCDVSDPSSVTDLVDTVTDRLGSIDVLVNNAGIFPFTQLTEMDNQTIQQTLAVNLAGAIYTTRAVLPEMEDRPGKSHIVSIASTVGVHGSPVDPVYAATKGGVISLTKSVARTWTKQGVFANVVAPAATDTEMYPEEIRPPAKKYSPISRLIKPVEVADAVRFFATTKATSGKVLELDGGTYI